MFTINAMSRNKELACHWKRKRTKLLSYNESDDNGGFRKLQNSMKNNPKSLRDLLKKYKSVHFSIEKKAGLNSGIILQRKWR